MRLAALITAACAGALVAVAVPSLSDFGPLRQAFHRDRSGLRPSALALASTPLAPPQSLKLDLGQAFPGEAESPMQQNDRRIQDLQAYTRSPSPLSGSRPN